MTAKFGAQTRRAFSLRNAARPAQSPMAAATPMAGAPRMIIVLMALRDVAVIRVGVMHHFAGQLELVENHYACGVHSMGSTVCNAFISVTRARRVLRTNFYCS